MTDLATEIGDVAGEAFAKANPVTAVLNAAGTLIDRLVPDKNAAAKHKADLEAAAIAAGFKADQDQRDITKLEAQSPHWFVAAARPALLWICNIAIFCYYVPYILAATVLWILQVIHTGELQPRIDLGIGDLLTLAGALLGTSALRSLDKANGVATDTIQWRGPRVLPPKA